MKTDRLLVGKTEIKKTGVKLSGKLVITMMSEYQSFMKFVQCCVTGDLACSILPEMRRAPYNHDTSGDPLGGIVWFRLQWVLGILGKFLLDSSPTLRRQLRDPAVNVLLEKSGYEPVV